MENKEINARIKQAFTSMVPDVLDSVLSGYEKQRGVVIAVTGKKKMNLWMTRICGIAAAFVILLSGVFGVNYYNHNFTVDSTISFDINPSIEIKVNRNERVLSTEALNEDGAAVIGDMDFKGSNLDVAVNAMIGSMLRNGYLNELANSILLSVENNDPVKGAELRRRLTREVDALLQTSHFNGAVLGQTISTEDELRGLAGTYGLTPGKAQLILNITEASKDYRFEDLAPLSINELNLLFSSGNAETENMQSVGKPSEKAYIGCEAAKGIAFDDAGLAASDVTAVKVELDWEHGVMIYEVEFKHGGYKYEYEIDAKTGTVYKIEREQDKTNEAKTADRPQAQETTAYIGEAEAKGIAFDDAGLAASDVTAVKVEMDWEHGVMVYEVEFRHGGYKYEYEIDAKTGEIREFEKERDN